MARNELLGSEKFSFAAYLDKSIEKHIHEMIEVNWKSWLLVIALLVACIAASLIMSQIKMREVLLIFLAVGWCLFLSTWLLFRLSEGTMDWMIMKGHQHRLAASFRHRQARAVRRVRRVLTRADA